MVMVIARLGSDSSLSPFLPIYLSIPYYPPSTFLLFCLILMSQFYAELLPNIKSISLSIILPTPATASTRVTVDAGSPSATVYHNGEYTRLILPGPANPSPQQLVVKADVGEKALSCRLPLASLTPAMRDSRENYAPWSAPELSSRQGVSFHCRTCSATLVPPGWINQWKDLPSENWADMMDFWHCHKPHDEGKDKAHDASGKYSLFGKGFAVDRGTGLVDRCYFLFSSKDCKAAQVSSRLNNDFLDSCLRCFCSVSVPSRLCAVGIVFYWATRGCPTAIRGTYSVVEAPIQLP